MMRRLIASSALLTCLLLSSIPSWAAFAEVGSGSQRLTGSAGNFASTTQAFNAAVTVNNLMVCGGNIWKSPAITDLVITDTRSSTWTVILGASGNEFVPFIAYALVPSSGTVTLTIDPTGGNNYGTWSCNEFSGNATSSVLDVDGGASTGTSTTPSDSITTGTANALIIGLVGNKTNSSVFLTEGSGYTLIGKTESASWAAHLLEYKIGTSATSYTADATMSSSVAWIMQTVSFEEAVGGANVSQFYRRRPR